MSGLPLFSGHAFSIADSKGRFVLPLEMRKLVKSSSDNENRLCVSIHEPHGCATGFGLSYKQKLEDDITAKAEAAMKNSVFFDDDAAREQAFASIEEVNFDDGGRFFLPPGIKQFCGIGDAILFVGVSRYLQLWDPARYDASEGRPAHVKASARAFLADRAGGAK